MNSHDHWIQAAKIKNLYEQPLLAAAAHTAIDLVDQGWTIQADKSGHVFTPPLASGDREKEKARIRRQEHLRRDEQLGQSSVQRFVEGMERTHQHGGRLVSIFNLMRDGRELADALQSAGASTDVIRPYVQIVDSSTCDLTGFKLHDIWRYFRHTWSNAYATVPGRSMPILIRDAATEFHTVIGLAAISSPVVQIAERDHWMGWETDQFLEQVRAEPTADIARWLARRIKIQQEEIYVDDLLRDGILQPTDLATPNSEAIGRLRADAERHRQRHHQASTIREVRNIERGAWVDRATTDLFRSKRSAALAETLEIVTLLGAYLSPPTAEGLTKAFSDSKARAQMRRVVRRARGERVGTVIADLTICGAVAPYNALVAGKLVGALAVSPRVLTAYREKYSRPSEIASAMAGRPILREPRLSFIGTTSLYGTGSSQYNRLFWPAEVMGGKSNARIGFHELGRSRSFGTSHFSSETVEALVRLSALRGSLVRVNNLFGEGVSPRLRKVRLGIAALGWPANELLRHGRERILYGVPLVENLRDYSLGVDEEPEYLLNPDLPEADARVANWWLERWCRQRAARQDVLESMRSHRLVRPVRHGARVPLPTADGMPPINQGMLPIFT
ncbi:Druantia anti-phage system protein DruA [Streptomyces sp. NPDC021225]|uniref:Druantia anti-phage system protein DruA n=1 Tax=Streptomyces sp. NPDC021225 TaxID=3365121 RepID=UPI0037B978F1